MVLFGLQLLVKLKSSFFFTVSQLYHDLVPEHLNSPPVFSGVRVARSLVFCEVFCLFV